MTRENIVTQSNETVIKVHNTEITAVRTKNIKRQGVRIYEDDRIGISGAVGDVDEALLVKQAEDNLKANIPYPYKPTKNLVDERDYSGRSYKPSELKNLTSQVLDVFRQEYPEFSFSHMVKYDEKVMTMTNTEGLNLSYRDSFLDMTFVIKEKSSANMMDGFVYCGSREIDQEKFLAFNRTMLDAYKKTVELPEGEILPCFFIDNVCGGFLSRQLNGEMYATKGSLYSDKMGEKLFDEKLTLYHNQNSKETIEPFFDMEGVVMKKDQQVLVKKGQLVATLTDKKTAADYNLPHTGGAQGSYDSRPSLGQIQVGFETTSTDIKSALGGQAAIFIMMSSGGDFTPDGSYAAPVQVGLLFDGEKFVGKLAEFSISSHIDKMLGEDYIGTFESDHLYFGDHTKVLGARMTVHRD